jgi:hypothetical protein
MIGKSPKEQKTGKEGRPTAENRRKRCLSDLKVRIIFHFGVPAVRPSKDLDQEQRRKRISDRAV